MPFCAKCGAQTEGAFCTQCGAPTGAAGATASTPAAAPVAGSGLQTNVAAALCYVLGLVTGILFLILEPYNRNATVRFHAFQSIFIHVAWIILWIGYTVLTVALPLVIHILASLLGLVVGLGGFLLWVYMMWKAYQGEKVVLPIVGPMAEQAAG